MRSDFKIFADADDKDAIFHTMHKSSLSYAAYVDKMKCIDEQYDIFGDFNTNNAANLMVTFEKCDPTVRQCKSKEEIDRWMKFKYIMSYQNEESY